MTSPPPDALRPLFQDALEMLRLVGAAFRRHDPRALDSAAALGRQVHKREKELTEALLATPLENEGLRFVPGHVERIGDAIEGLIRCLQTIEREGTAFTERGEREVNELVERAGDLVECARDLAATGSGVLARHLEIESMRFHEVASDFARAHEERLVEGVCLPRASSAYLAMLDYLREVVRHARQVGARVARTPPPGARAPAVPPPGAR